MQSKILLKWLLIILIVVIIIILHRPLFKFNYFVINQASENLEIVEGIVFQKQENLGVPVNIKIPSVGVDAFLESVGLTPQGLVDVPKIYTNAAWYNLSPRPGEVGNSIIDGHSGWKIGKQSVFDNLYKIKKGDKLYVEDENGLIITFIVRYFRTYTLNEDTTDIFNSSDDKAHLNLITCVTHNNADKKTLDDKFVVFADKEE